MAMRSPERAGSSGGPAFWFAVDGVRVLQEGWHWYPHRWAGGLFTADFAEVARLLPCARLHPVRWGRRRALVCAFGACQLAVGGAPPLFGYGEVGLLAWVTWGDEPAPPLAPFLGGWARARYQTGFYTLLSAVTSRVAGELSRVVMGTRAVVADVRNEQRPDRERFVCEASGRLLWDLTVRSDGHPFGGSQSEQAWYADQDGEVFMMPVAGSGVSRVRFGGSAARLVLGEHRLAENVRRLRLSRVPVAGEFCPDVHDWLSGPPRILGPARRREAPGTGQGAIVAGRLAVSYAPGVEVEVDQGLGHLGFDPSGTFTGRTLHDRAAA